MKQPAWIAPMLATLVKEPFSNEEWIFEKKYDGVRCLVFRNGAAVHLYSRNHILLDATYPEIKEAFEKQKCKHFIVDGEITGKKGGLESFSILQSRMNIQTSERAIGTKVKVTFYAFDLLFYEGKDLRKTPLIERKSLLSKAFRYGGASQYTSHKVKEGKRFFKAACKKGWEGVIAKRANSFYVSKRSRDWLKFKSVASQEFIICGYTPPQGSRIGFGALLIGYYEKGSLRYAGKVGTGYDENLLKSLFLILKKLEIKKSPFSEEIGIREAHWVKPKLVAEIGFTEWTNDGKLRHPSFLGLRKDKSAKEVKRERPR